MNAHPIIYHLDDGKVARGVRIGVSSIPGESHLVVDLSTGDGPSVVGVPDWFDRDYVAYWRGLVPECGKMGTEPGDWEFAEMLSMNPSDPTSRATTRTRRETPVKIVWQGAIVVGSAWVEAEGADVVAIGLDCSTKYFEVSTSTHYTGEGYEGWTMHLTSCEETKHMAEGIDRELPTDVILPEFRSGWRPWAYDRGGRYMASICLVREEPDGETS